MTVVYTRQQIERAVKPQAAIEAMEEGFIAYSRGEVVVPPVGHLEFQDPPGDCHIKYGHIRGDDTFTVKIASGFYRNPQAGLPSSHGVMLVFSSRTGELLAILQDDGYLTDARTAAAGAVAAKYLAPSQVRRIGILGAGIQARMQLQYLKAVTDCRRVSLWARNLERAQAFAVDGFTIDVRASVAEVAAESELIVTTTPARQSLLAAESVTAGTHVTAVGADSPGKQELDPKLFVRAAIRAVDSRSQCSLYGDSSHALRAGTLQPEAMTELGELILDPARRRTEESQITIADLTGVAIQDIQIAKLALRVLSGSG